MYIHILLQETKSRELVLMCNDHPATARNQNLYLLDEIQKYRSCHKRNWDLKLIQEHKNLHI